MAKRMPFLEALEKDQAAGEERLSRISAQRKALEDRTEALSGANKLHLSKLQDFEVKINKELEARRQEYQKHIDKGTIRTSAGNAARSRLFQVINRKKRFDKSGKVNYRDLYELEKPFVDRSLNYNPVHDIKTVFGTSAYARAVVSPRSYFRTPEIARPCVERLVRKEVMFAKKHAGKAHRTRKKRNPLSNIWC